MTTLKIAELIEQNFPQDFIPQGEIDKLKEQIESDSFIQRLLLLNDTPVYNIFDVENLLGKATSLINLLINKREELISLEIALYSQTLNTLLKNINHQNDKKNYLIEENYLNFISSQLVNNVEIINELNSIKGSINSIETSRNMQTEILEVKKNKLDQIKNLENQYEEFKNLNDSGLNFFSRYLENREIYRELFVEFFQIVNSLELGAESVYNINNPKPNLRSEDLLNSYFFWLKKLTFELNKIIQNEQEYDLIISLRQGCYDINGLIAGTNIPNFNTQRDAGTLIFNLPQNILPNKKLIRLRDISVKLDVADNDPNWNNEVFPLKIKIPNQIKSNGDIVPIPEYFINATHYFNNSTLQNSVGNSIHNCNPFANDSWQISIPTRGVFFRDGSTSRNGLRDIYLILRVAFIN